MIPTTAQLGGRVPKQIQRCLPVYVACLLFVILMANLGSLGPSIKMPGVLRRDISSSMVASSHEFPKKIWQTWKVDPLEMEERDSTTARTWTHKNPSYRYEVLTDGNDMHYVEKHFGPGGLNRLDIVHMYRTLTARIIKADLLRYLVMYIEGGVYSDIDVEALKPMDRFIPDRYKERDIDMIIGVEIDQPDFKDHPILGKKSQSFCQWTFVAKPRLPVMLALVDNIIKWLNDVSKRQKVPVSEVHLDFDEVISGTGPSAFTTAILAQMSKREGRSITWDTFHNMDESKLVGGVLVLTVEAFCAGQGHSDSGNHNARTALVKHHYHASGWPSAHPRQNHPVYGEVEKCNWEHECVNTWDENVAKFDSLSPEEKAQQIALKEAADKALAEAAEASKNDPLNNPLAQKPMFPDHDLPDLPPGTVFPDHDLPDLPPGMKFPDKDIPDDAVSPDKPIPEPQMPPAEPPTFPPAQEPQRPTLPALNAKPPEKPLP